MKRSEVDVGRNRLLLNMFAAMILFTAPCMAASPSEPDFKPYMKHLQHMIKHDWLPPKSDKTTKAVLKFKIDRQGDLSDIQVSSSSGNKSFDDAAIDTLRKFHADPLPDGAPESVDIEFTFDYNVHNRAHTAQHKHLTDRLQALGDSDTFRQQAGIVTLLALGAFLLGAGIIVVWLLIENARRNKRE